MADNNKYFKIVPKANVVPALVTCEADSKGKTCDEPACEAIGMFAFVMLPDMNNYFEAVEITKDEYDKLSDYAIDFVKVPPQTTVFGGEPND